MYTFILKENANKEEINKLLAEINTFVKKVNPGWDDEIYPVSIVDKTFVMDRADGFGSELREIGTIGLTKKYVGRYCVHIYGNVPYWITDLIRNLIHAEIEVFDR